MLENLFGSQTRYRLLKLFLANPNRSFYVREITRRVNRQINSVRRELSNLMAIGFITSDASQNKLYYEVNQKFSKYEELANLFSDEVLKTKSPKKTVSKKSDKVPMSASDKISASEKILGNVSLVVLGGVFTLDKKSPADLLIVGNVTPTGLKNYVANLENTIDTEIRYLVLDENDFRYRLSIRDKSVSLILDSKLVVRVDKNNLINAN